MVGTTRFELATSPTPRVRSTRLSHVPTCVSLIVQADDGGVSCTTECTRARPEKPPVPSGLAGQNIWTRNLVARRHIFLRQRAAFAFAEEEAVHLLHQKVLRLTSPRLQPVLVQQHLLPLDPLAPGLLRNILVNLLSEIGVERRFV